MGNPIAAQIPAINKRVIGFGNKNKKFLRGMALKMQFVLLNLSSVFFFINKAHRN